MKAVDEYDDPGLEIVSPRSKTRTCSDKAQK